MEQGEPAQSDFEKAAEIQAAEKPFPKMTAKSAWISSLTIAIAMVLPILGIVFYSFENGKLELGFVASGILFLVALVYFLILYGIVKRRRQM